MKQAQGLYIISVAAQILDLHPQTLRKYERAGFVEPPRMGVLRLYSDEDIARLRLIKYFVEELGLNLAGVELALKITSRLLALRDALASDKELEPARAEALEEVDAILHSLGLRIAERQGPQPQPGPQLAPGEGRRSQVRFDAVWERQSESPARGR